MRTELAILSPEKTIVTYPLSSLGGRISAQLLDLFLIGILEFCLVLLSSTLGVISSAASMAFLLISTSSFVFLYFILLEGLWNGQTIGKKAMKLRVRMADGTAVTFQAALGRNLLRPGDFFPAFYFAGFVCMFTNPKSQRLGDLIANTVVVSEKRPQAIFAAAPYFAGTHALEQYVGELRGMTLEEYQALKKFCDRFPELSYGVQQKLLLQVWRPVAQLRQIPELPNVHPLYLAEAAVMKYGRRHGLL